MVGCRAGSFLGGKSKISFPHAPIPDHSSILICRTEIKSKKREKVCKELGTSLPVWVMFKIFVECLRHLSNVGAGC